MIQEAYEPGAASNLLTYLSQFTFADPLDVLREESEEEQQPATTLRARGTQPAIGQPMPKAPEVFVLDFHSLGEFYAYKELVCDISEINSCYESDENHINWNRTNVTNYSLRVKRDLEKMSVADEEDFDEINEDVAERIAQNANARLYPVLQGCYRSRNSLADNAFAVRLQEAIEQYLAKVGFTKCRDLRENDTFTDPDNCWRTPIKDPSGAPWKAGQIAEIEVYPYALRFMSDNGEIEKRFIKGSCTIYMK